MDPNKILPTDDNTFHIDTVQIEEPINAIKLLNFLDYEINKVLLEWT